VGATASYPVHAGEAATLAEVQGQIAIMFRALGGEAGVQIAGAKARQSGHRLGWRQRIGLGDESIDHPGRDGATVFLPDRIALFPDRELNALLYRWLAAWFATAPVAATDEIDPLRRDLVTLRRAQPQRKKLLLVLTDGKPNDVDHYEGRFAVEDTRKAVREARRLGVAVFGVTVDAGAQSYFPALFGRGGYAIVGNIRRLPAALPAIYQQLAG
jgi:nitric oxide reductase activation protein